MTLKECYQVLGLSQTASLEEIKRAYRRRAFELHPDLNPHLADAGLQFQKLNEAYVILTKLVAVREAREGKKAGASAAEQTEKRQEGTQSTAENPHADTSAGEATASDSTAKQTADASKETTENPGKETGASTAQASGTGKASENTAQTDQKPGHHLGDTVYAEQQEVLQDILKDPFARRVFQDIYSEIRKMGPQKTPESPPKEQPAVSTLPRSTPLLKKTRRSPATGTGLGFHWSDSFNLDFSKGIGGAIKNWLRNQIDEEQLFELPARRLVPGARIRLQIRRGLSDEVTTLDVTLPPDFKPDKPIRLKGMGKKLGHWQGDLYLRFSPKR